MKRLSETEDDLVLEIPTVVGVRPIRVQPPLVIIVFDVEDVRIAIGVGNVYTPVRTTTPRILLGLYSIRHRNDVGACTK